MDRLIRAIENPHMVIIGHPGSRSYLKQGQTDLDWDRIFQATAFYKVALEINSYKAHPFFDAEKVPPAVAMGVQITLNSDAHVDTMLDNTNFGINIARRAGLAKNNVINTWATNHLKIWLNRKRASIALGQ